jgi:two-component system, LytTR family, sensor kinase
MITPSQKRRLYWICQCSGWGLYAVFNTLLINVYMRMPLVTSFGLLSYGLAGLLVTHTLRAYIHRVGLMAKPWRTIALHTVVMVPLGALALTALIQLCWFLVAKSSMANTYVSLVSIIAGILFNMMFLMLIWLLIYFTFHLIWRSIALRETQLNALQAQINPHFLFNSLNSLRGLILENPQAAQDAVTRLSQLMRYSLTQSRRPTVPLQEELDAIHDYLAIEKIRFEDRLHITWLIDPNINHLEVPPMSLQTLVENALKHGIAHLPAGGTIAITASLQDHNLTLKVTNPGLLQSDPDNSTGTGLNNVRERLHLLRGPQATLNLRQLPGQVEATIVIPTA